MRVKPTKHDDTVLFELIGDNITGIYRATNGPGLSVGKMSRLIQYNHNHNDNVLVSYINFEQYYFSCLIPSAEYNFSSYHYEVDEGVGVDTQVTLTVKRTGVLAERTIGKIY